MTEALPRYADIAKNLASRSEPALPDYVKLVTAHNRRVK